MSDKMIMPMQAFGLGDILFTQNIARRWLDEGHQVLWGVDSHYVNIGKHFPHITFIDKEFINPECYLKKYFYSKHNVTVVPLRWANEIMKVPYKDCMRAKYDVMGMDWKNWKDFEFKRDHFNENDLFYNVLGLKDGEKYNLISRFFRGDKSGEVKIECANGLRNVYLTEMSGFTLLDWGRIIENATEIHTVGSSINYLIEILKVKAEAIHLYVRKPDEKDFKNYDYILSKDLPYIFHA